MNIYTQLFLVGFVLWMVISLLWKRYVRCVTVWDFQSALHYKDGKFVRTLHSGKHRLWGNGHSVVFYEDRVIELVVQSQELVTSDSATLKLSAVAQYQIQDARRFHEASEDSRQALYTQVQLALRRIFGALDLDTILEEKAGFSEPLLAAVRSSTVTNTLGVEVHGVVVRDLMLGGEVKAALVSVLKARKEAQAKQETARGDAAALRTMANAARVFENNPELLRLRYLETLKEVGTSYGNTLFIGMPDEFASLALTASSKRSELP